MNKYEVDREMVRTSLIEQYGFNPEQADVIESYAYEQLHAFWSDYLNGWEDVADFVLEVLKYQSRGEA